MQLWQESLGPSSKSFAVSSTGPIQSAVRIVDAVKESLAEILESDRDSLLLGEDVADPLGGVFRLTKGLSSRFPGQVMNSPLAEATIIGVAHGRASCGHLTIAEIQFVDFLAPGWNQLTTNVASQSWRTDHTWQTPVILYAVAGAYSPGAGMFHSQVNAAALCHQQDLIVAYPSCPGDVRRVFKNAKVNRCPTFILLPKARLWDRVESNCDPVSDYSARLLQSGNDVTLVSWGNGIAISKAALSSLKGIAVELIDLCISIRWILIAWNNRSTKRDVWLWLMKISVLVQLVPTLFGGLQQTSLAGRHLNAGRSSSQDLVNMSPQRSMENGGYCLFQQISRWPWRGQWSLEIEHPNLCPASSCRTQQLKA